MDKETFKLTLGAYRAGTPDKDDPFFAEALRAVAQDPDLAQWFAEQQRFDSLMVTTLKQATPPADLKGSILLQARSAARSATLRNAAVPFLKRPTTIWLAAAACVLLAFVLGRETVIHSTFSAPHSERDSRGSDGLALQAIAYTGKMPALQFVCFDASAVAKWVTEKSTALHMGKLLDKPLNGMQMIGSSTADWDGRPVIMVALQNKKQMGMLYLVRAADFPGVDGNGEVVQKDGWISKIGRNGEHLYVLTTKGNRKDLDFPMPF